MKLIKAKDEKKESLSLKFKGKKYSFSTRSLILFPIGTYILANLIIQFFGMKQNNWLHEIIAKHSVFLMNLFFNVEAEALFLPEYYFPWFISIPDSVRTYMTNGCTYIPSMSIFTAIIIFTPHSKDTKTKEDIIWRKTKDIIATLILIYTFNIFRIAIQNYLFHLGFAWKTVHDSVLTYTIVVIVHILIFLSCNRKIPELFVSIYYAGKIIYINLRKVNPGETYTYLKQIDQKGKYNEERKLFKKDGMSLNLIKIYDIDSRLIQFLKENRHKYTAIAIKNRVFNQHEKVTEDLLEDLLQFLLSTKTVLSENYKGKTYYYI